MLELKVHDSKRGEVMLRFEHSLRSISKWEQKNKKPFLSQQRNAYEMISYYKEMLLDGEDPNQVYNLSAEQLEAVGKYINDPQTASSVPDSGESKNSDEAITSELVYYWMTELRIPWEAQDWHYNRLSMLIQIAAHKKEPPKKQKVSDFRSRWQTANRANRERFNSKG